MLTLKTKTEKNKTPPPLKLENVTLIANRKRNGTNTVAVSDVVKE